LQRATHFRRLWSAYQQNKDLVQVGAYQPGSNADLDRALALKEAILGFLIQDMDQACDLSESMHALGSLLDE
ncbi:MAG TPA: flagellum-specific ATP synthase FliI, partial [Gammaproteobacteria bacterium]|nr:flagellum-specific ATP synthase FliI [Gammaproteobacteria bacterium]